MERGVWKARFETARVVFLPRGFPICRRLKKSHGAMSAEIPTRSLRLRITSLPRTRDGWGTPWPLPLMEDTLLCLATHGKSIFGYTICIFRNGLISDRPPFIQTKTG